MAAMGFICASLLFRALVLPTTDRVVPCFLACSRQHAWPSCQTSCIVILKNPKILVTRLVHQNATPLERLFYIPACSGEHTPVSLVAYPPTKRIQSWREDLRFSAAVCIQRFSCEHLPLFLQTVTSIEKNRNREWQCWKIRKCFLAAHWATASHRRLPMLHSFFVVSDFES